MIAINTNILSNFTCRQLSLATRGLNESTERLTTGKKLNQAADGASDMAISGKFFKNLSGTKIAQENVLQSVNMLDTADAALEEMTNLVNRIADLSVQSMNGTYSDKERMQMQQEVAKLTDELYRQKNSTKYNQINLFGTPEQNPANLDPAIPDEPFESERIRLQVGAFASEYDAIEIELGFSLEGFNGDVSTVEKAEETLAVVDTLRRRLLDYRSDVGASRNHLEGVLVSQDVKKEYLSSSYSTMIDVDFAKETATLAKYQILQQSTGSLLSQAKVMPEMALQLIAA